jgi:hypothetical protein
LISAILVLTRAPIASRRSALASTYSPSTSSLPAATAIAASTTTAAAAAARPPAMAARGRYVLGIDVGTQGTKALLYHLDTHAVAGRAGGGC